MFNLMGKPSTAERGVFLLNQPISETKALSQKVEELEGVQALERDRLVSMNKTVESKISEIEDMIKTLLAQAGASKGNCKSHETSSNSMPKSGRSMDNERCFYCGRMGHFQADCDDLKSQIQSGNLKLNPEGKLRLRDGSFIPGFPNGSTLKERVDKHYSRKPSQYFYGEYEDEDPVSPPVPKYPTQLMQTNEDAERRCARLEKELDLREKEAALALRKLKLEGEEKKLEQTTGGTRMTNVFDLLGQLTDEEVAAIKASRSSGFP
jgi:hypothetical protein